MTRRWTVVASPVVACFFAALVGGCSENGILPPSPLIFPQIDCCPSWHPSGNTVIFYHQGISSLNSDGSYVVDPNLIGLWTIDTTATYSRQLLRWNAFYPSYSPDATSLAFELGAQIFTAHVQNDTIPLASIRQLTFRGRNFFPCWNSTGEWIAYDNTQCALSLDAIDSCGIYVMRGDGSERTLIKAHARMPNWSPDGNHLLYVSSDNSDIYRVRIADPSQVTRLTLFNTSQIIRTNSRPKYCGDGSFIVFQSNKDSRTTLWIMRSDGADLRELIDGSDPAWSPDCRSIVFSRPSSTPADNGTLWVIRVADKSLKRLTEGPVP
jgi:hypothetical protein